MTLDSDNARLPDVATGAEPVAGGALDWVGMDGIDLPVRCADGQGGTLVVPARISVQVNLADPGARGIHMSRLYLALEQSLGEQALTPSGLRSLLHALVASHAGLSGRARLRIDYAQMMKRRALVSDNAGWRSYPVTVTAQLLDERFSVQLGCEVTYSSTCPASAALSRQLNQQRFDEDFSDMLPSQRSVREWLGSERGMAATPHAQRSTARVTVRLAPGFDLPVAELIDAVERALATPVQTAVKREDEQAFARLNADNLMFCEDAARRVRTALDADERIAGYHIVASHHESLHPHDAVAEVSKHFPG
ncbi:MAG TPA: GTP cyclohydrolase FolE2 [Rhodanobacteraceae bacterium]|jgi:GTP cyclohydrolase I|nr:GTP cyclohydrolase FolE2 [Rhodanobacteraceae bacterium]